VSHSLVFIVGHLLRHEAASPPCMAIEGGGSLIGVADGSLFGLIIKKSEAACLDSRLIL